MRVDSGTTTDVHVRFGGNGRRSFVAIGVVAALVVVAFGLGRRTGSSSGTEGTSVVDIVPSTTSTTVVDSADDGPSFRILAGADVEDLRLHVVRLPFNRGPRDAVVHRYLDGQLLAVAAVEPLFSNGRVETLRSQPGDVRDYLLATPAGLVITSAGVASLHDPVTGSSRVFADGIATLPGPDPRTFWLFTSAERSVHRVELSVDGTPVLSEPFPLDVVGRPLASTGDGLVVRLSGDGRPGDLGVWWPDRKPITLIDSAEAVFLGAGGGTVALLRGDELEVIAADEPEEAVRFSIDDVERIHRSTVSPDGRLLAVSILTDLTEANRIEILELETGRRVERISPAIELFFRWADTGTLVFMEPDLPAFELVARDVATGEDRRLARFDDLTWWFATEGREDR